MNGLALVHGVRNISPEQELQEYAQSRALGSPAREADRSSWITYLGKGVFNLPLGASIPGGLHVDEARAIVENLEITFPCGFVFDNPDSYRYTSAWVIPRDHYHALALAGQKPLQAECSQRKKCFWTPLCEKNGFRHLSDMLTCDHVLQFTRPPLMIPSENGLPTVLCRECSLDSLSGKDEHQKCICTHCLAALLRKNNFRAMADKLDAQAELKGRH